MLCRKSSVLEFIGAVFSGAILVIGIIAGIGPQNFNTMSHGIRRNHEYWVATTCFLADAVLILIGCIGLSLTNSKLFILLINIIGVAFLSYYLWIKVRDFNKPHNIKFNHEILSKKAAILRALGLTWLNPLVFIDTIVVIGGASTHHIGWQHTAFTLGALLGDFIWLYGLTLISRTFAEKLNRPQVWMLIDVSTIILVAIILIKMISYFLL